MGGGETLCNSFVRTLCSVHRSLVVKRATSMNSSAPPPNPKIESASRRCGELFHRVTLSQAIVTSALEVPRVSAELTEKVRQSHLSGESGVRDVLTRYKLIVPIEAGQPLEPEKVLPLLADGLAKQAAVNVEMVISAAVVILSHSIADDVFTEVCKLAIDLDPAKWVPLLNLQSKITLESLRNKGFDGVFEEELQRFKAQLGGRSLPNRAKLLFQQIPIQMNQSIPKGDPMYFSVSKLKDADVLRHDLVHGNGLPHIEPTSGTVCAGFLHEAAHTALRSVISACGILTKPGRLDVFVCSSNSNCVSEGVAGVAGPTGSRE